MQRQFESFRRSFRRKRRCSTSGSEQSRNKKRRRSVDGSLKFSEGDYDIQQKIDLEIKMREGTRKLLAACKRETQSLEAAKTLLTSHARVLTYMGELQRRKTEECLERISLNDGKKPQSAKMGTKPCKGQISISDIRIPLMWRNADHIMDKGDHHRYAVFCLLKVGTEIYDTEIKLNVDRRDCDIIFDDVFVFDKVEAGFNFILEVYSYNLHRDLTIASTPQRIRKRLNSISGSVKKSENSVVVPTVSAEEDNTAVEAPKFTLVGRANLRLKDSSEYVKTHGLSLEGGDRMHIPLFNHFCCRLAVQPDCMVNEGGYGFLTVKEKSLGDVSCQRLWCRLRGSRLQFWTNPSEADCKAAVFTVDLKKVTKCEQLDTIEEDLPFPFSLVYKNSDLHSRQKFSAESVPDLQRWTKILDQQILNIGTWKEACDSLMTVKTPRAFTRRGSERLRKKATLYEQTSLYSPDKTNNENESPPSVSLKPRLQHSQSVSAAPPEHLMDPLARLKETSV